MSREHSKALSMSTPISSAPVVRKKLIEVALPLDAINAAAAREKSIRHGHPSTLHLWWARRPLAAARAVIFAQMVDDPSSHPELFPTQESVKKERERLFAIITKLVVWENTTNEDVLNEARAEIRKSWERTCADNANHPCAGELFDSQKLPAFHDPFAGGGALPLEAQRLGLESYASDLNPVAVLINKAMIEIPPKFAGRPPVNPDAQNDTAREHGWPGATGLAEDVRYYGQWMRREAEKIIAELYPRIKITKDVVQKQPILRSYLGEELTVIAWLWARTVRSPNPALGGAEVPLTSTFILSSKAGREAWVEPVISGNSYRFEVRMGKPPAGAENGTKSGSKGSDFKCIFSQTIIPGKYIKEESMKGRMGARLMAVVAEGKRGRVYLPPNQDTDLGELEERAKIIRETFPTMNRDTANLVSGRGYGFFTWGDLFTSRQLMALTTFGDLMQKVREIIHQDAKETDVQDYAEAVSVYLGFLVSQLANHSSSICGWNHPNTQMRSVFSRQAIPMVWDFAEANILSDSTGSFNNLFERQIKGLGALIGNGAGHAMQADAQTQRISIDKVISTDPPYYDNISYADLSDFFYVWLRKSLGPIYPELFGTLVVPKTDELVATPYRHGSKEAAEKFFLDGMTSAIENLAKLSHPAFPVTIYYAFKQSELKSEGRSNTGWATFLEAVIRVGFAVTGTWPMRTEKEGRTIGNGTNALASSIILVCRKRDENACSISRRDFLRELNTELPKALADMTSGSPIAPVDLEQAIIGPGMAVFSKYKQVEDNEGNAMSVAEALATIIQVKDAVLSEHEGDYDHETRWALAWFAQYGFDAARYGDAETLANAKNISVSALLEAGILESGGGKARLLRPAELPRDWSPKTDSRLTVWEMTHHLVRLWHVENAGEPATAALMREMGDRADDARSLAYRLFNMAERSGRGADAQGYNALVSGWGVLAALAAETPAAKPEQGKLL